MSSVSINDTHSTLSGVAPLLDFSTRAAIAASRDDRWSTRPGFVPYGGINFVVDTPILPVNQAAFERLLGEEQRDGVRLRLERRRGNRVPVIDLCIRERWTFAWMYDYTLAVSTDCDLYFVPRLMGGPVFQIMGGVLKHLADHGEVERFLCRDTGAKILHSLIWSRGA